MRGFVGAGALEFEVNFQKRVVVSGESASLEERETSAEMLANAQVLRCAQDDNRFEPELT